MGGHCHRRIIVRPRCKDDDGCAEKWVDLKRAAWKANSEATRPQTGGGPKPEAVVRGPDPGHSGARQLSCQWDCR